jgi:hypothetical protein
MIEEELRKWAEVAKRSGRKGWVLVREGRVLEVFNNRRDAVMAAKEPGVYLLIFVE